MAQLLNSVVGHQEKIQFLLQAHQRGQLPHAFLFTGPAGVGKKTTALGLAQVLLCEKKTGCGLCGSCLRVTQFVMAKKKDSQGTEALLLIEPEKNQIKIDQAHQVLEFLQLKAFNTVRVIIINDADRFNPQAGNALLKVLEEPPENTFFFLIAPSPTQVLLTLRSRCQNVRFSPLSLEQMKARSQAPEWALRASLGSFERLEQLTDPDELELRESAKAWLQDWVSEPQGYLKSVHRDLVRDRQVARRLARHLSWLLRDTVYLKIGAWRKVLNVDQQSFLQDLAEKMPFEPLVQAGEKCLNLVQQIDQNRDAALVFEQFWIETRPCDNLHS
ncbi:MAG: DNA polymerase III subunit delta' [Bdellovibrio sp. CG10_big_fil_rev_8_21_14_0_10_47_8]|nr:MAG: DNA polymerase III subunit delta' [Bdellovibrio sp. CG10_big_fil_rev_8_21_14_0_10_47_8]